MDPFSLTVGVLGLASLYNTCLDILDKVDSYKEYGIDSRSIIAQFEADKLLFRKWGKSVGIDQDMLLDNHHANLEDPETATSVARILSSVQELHLGTNDVRLGIQPTLKSDLKLELKLDQKLNSSSSSILTIEGHMLDGPVQRPTSRRKKMAWAFRNKTRFIAQVQQFGVLIEKLHRLVPSDDIKEATSLHRGVFDDNLPSLSGMYILIALMKEI
jgi:Prion-inhibition and propagation